MTLLTENFFIKNGFTKEPFKQNRNRNCVYFTKSLTTNDDNRIDIIINKSNTNLYSIIVKLLFINGNEEIIVKKLFYYPFNDYKTLERLLISFNDDTVNNFIKELKF